MCTAMCYYRCVGGKIHHRSLATLNDHADTESAVAMAAFLCPVSILRVGCRGAARHSRSRCPGIANSVAHPFSMEQS